ncbi:hypothetical protein [Streptomyces phaeochromogenes]|nr:hypothetical protein [Streptomyces phaeochromogenes]
MFASTADTVTDGKPVQPRGYVQLAEGRPPPSRTAGSEELSWTP